MKFEEEAKLAIELAQSRKFMDTYLDFLEQNNNQEIDLHTVATWFFLKGYIGCLEHNDEKKMTKPYVYNKGLQ